MSSAVRNLISADRWSLIAGTADANPYVLRFRTPVLGLGQAGDFATLLRCVWIFGREDSHELPDQNEDFRMKTFEDRLCDAWEQTGNAVLTAVLTICGARQWVFYTRSPSTCVELLQGMHQDKFPYPIELDAQKDADWSYLRDQIVGSRGEA